MTELERTAELLQELATRDPEIAQAIREINTRKVQGKNLIKPDTWQALTMAEALQDRPPIEYAVAGLFEHPSLNIVYGAPGCLKSFVLADMAVCVASGKPWLEPLPDGKLQPKQTKSGGILWVDNDNGKRRSLDRFRSLMIGHEFSQDIPIHLFCNPNPPLNANDPNSTDDLTARVQSYGASVVIIDNLGTITGEAEENSAEMAHVMANLRRLAENTNAAVILIHHQRKGGSNGSRSGDALRGHSSIEAALDLALWVEREPGSDQITIKPTKTRGADVDPFAAYFSYENDQGGTMKSARFFGYPSQVETEKTLTSWALDVLREAEKTEPKINQTMLRELLKESYEGDFKMTETKARRLISTLENTKKVRVTKGERGAKYYSACQLVELVKST